MRTEKELKMYAYIHIYLHTYVHAYICTHIYKWIELLKIKIKTCRWET